MITSRRTQKKMKHHKNSRDAASPAPLSPQQIPAAAAFVPTPQQQAPLSARRNSTPTLPAAAQSSQTYVVLRTPAVAIAQFLINAQIIRNQRNCLQAIISTHF